MERAEYMSWVYRVESPYTGWVMTAPLSTIADVYRLRREAVMRIVSCEYEPVDLYMKGMKITLKRAEWGHND